MASKTSEARFLGNRPPVPPPGVWHNMNSKSHIDCQSSNVLYELHCLRDSMHYLGETSKTAQGMFKKYIKHKKKHKYLKFLGLKNFSNNLKESSICVSVKNI